MPVVAYRWFRFIPFLLLLIPLRLSAQVSGQIQLFRPRNEDRPIRFGIGVGLNVMDFQIRNTGLRTPNAKGDTLRLWATTDRVHPGFNVNALVRFRLTDQMHIRVLPGICFGQREIEFYHVDDKGVKEFANRTKIESNYIEMPILFCYSARRFSNARPYAVAGINPRADMAAFKRLKIESGQFLRLRKIDLAYEIGFGFEFYFPYFKMAPEVKWSSGFANVLVNDFAEGYEAHHAALKRVMPQAVVFSLIFE